MLIERLDSELDIKEIIQIDDGIVTIFDNELGVKNIIQLEG
jgi:hypothetical protein